MSKKVNGAFSTFLNDVVNVKRNDSVLGKNSRDYLLKQIHSLSDDGDIPKTISSYDLAFGSFSRKTKTDPLNDIDFIFCYAGGDLEYSINGWDNCTLKLKNMNNDALKQLCDTDTLYYYGIKNYYLNSNKVKNNLLSALSKISKYNKAELHARGEAVTLSLSSYDWTFDIVPAFYCVEDSEDFYLIPNGKGGWKKTNPKIEQKRVNRLNQKFNGKVLETIRLIKYWNKRGKMPTVTSYLLETMVLDYFESASHYSIDNEDRDKTYDYCDFHFTKALKYISNNIYNSVFDPKGIQGNINNLSYNDKIKLCIRCKNDYEKGKTALDAEVIENNHEKAINIWREVFGDDFPKYE